MSINVKDNGLAMKRTLGIIAFILIITGLSMQGCASSPETIDTDQIHQHSEEGFKGLQKEEDLRR